MSGRVLILLSDRPRLIFPVFYCLNLWMFIIQGRHVPSSDHAQKNISYLILQEKTCRTRSLNTFISSPWSFLICWISFYYSHHCYCYYTKYTIDYISSLLDIDIVYFDENQLTCDWEICQKRFSHSRQLESFHHSWIEKFISDWMNESQGKGDIDDYGDNYEMGFLLKVNLMLPWTL